jgi:hypothetical protein
MNTPNKQAELEKAFKNCVNENQELKERIQELESLRNWSGKTFKEQGIKEGKAQALSEFKEKLKEVLFKEAKDRNLPLTASSLDRLPCNYVNKIIDKTAQEIK